MTAAQLYDFFYGSGSINHTTLMFINKANAPVLDAVMPVATFLGSSNLFPFYFLLLLVLYSLDKKLMPAKYLVVYLVAGLISFGVEGYLKDLFHVPRPPFALGGGSVRVLGRVRSTFALPSGHAVFAFMTASAIAHGRGRWCKFLLFFCALLVAYSRVYMGHHYPLDVLVGGVVGSGCAVAGWKGWGYIEEWYRARSKSSF